MQPPNHGVDVEKQLEELPDLVADALLKWRTATLNREELEAILYLKFKNDPEVKNRTVSEIEALIKSNSERYDIRLTEALAESEHQRLYERLMSFKRIANTRTAF